MAVHRVTKRRVPVGKMVRPSRGARVGRRRPGIPKKRWSNCAGLALVGVSLLVWSGAKAQTCPNSSPSASDPDLGVKQVVGCLSRPTTMAFLPSTPGTLDMLVLEKRNGIVRHLVKDGDTVSNLGPVLDLAVNWSGPRGLLGIALHPEIATNRDKQWVYLFWTERYPKDPSDDTKDIGPTTPGGVNAVPVLGNRVDRFKWDGSRLTFDSNLIRLRAMQANPVPTGHQGGVLRFGPDGKLYIDVGDVGRRGLLQNLPCGPTEECPGTDDFVEGKPGGPQPDNAHLTGVILRLNDDGSTPGDNPFFAAYENQATMGNAGEKEIALNIQKIFAYGIRNAYGMDFDPASGNLWLAENGEDSFTELHRIEAGQNGGWIQIRGPVSRIKQYKDIETGNGPDPCNGPAFVGLEQDRFDPTLIADTPADALSRLVMLDDFMPVEQRVAHYRDPEFSWKFEVAPAGIGFLKGLGLGPQYENDLFMGAIETDDALKNGYLLHFKLTGNRRKIAVDDPRLEDRVADNTCASPLAESESLRFGQDFGVVTHIQTGPNGNLFVVSNAPLEASPDNSGSIYEISRQH
jgi:glucose/arabinose dehydrogenase